MNETADVASNLPAIVLLSFWWALVSMLEVLSRQGQPPDTPSAGRQTGEAPEAGDEQDFPEIREADPDFSNAAFLQGACQAYEEILRAYALCDAKALQAFLSTEVFRAFMDAFDARSARGETLELTFVGMQSSGITSVEVGAEAIEITVLFHAQVIQAERSSVGDVIRGDSADVFAVADLWTFSRPRRAGAANWTVVATGQPPETV